MSEELKVKRSYAIPENEMVIIKDTNTLLHNIVDSELKEKDKEIERLKNDIKRITEITNQKIKIINNTIKYCKNSNLTLKSHYFIDVINLLEGNEIDEKI